MTRTKKKKATTRHHLPMNHAQRSELARARRISTAGPLPGLQAYFRAHLPPELMTDGQ